MASDGDAIDPKIIKQLLEDIYKSDMPNKRALFIATFRKLAAGIIKGYGKTITKVKYNTPDFSMLNSLSYNVGVFSIFKNHDYIKETVKLLKDQDGNLRSKEDFIKEAQKLSDKYNKRYLATEYDQAVGAARMAKKWQDIERTRDLYPNLRYVAVMDERTRELHKNWHGIILPINHKFWKTHYPPNDWGCRCTVRRTDKAVNDKGLNVDDIPNLPKQFNINVGQTGKVFNNEHPYFRISEYRRVAGEAKKALTSYTQREFLNHFQSLKQQFTIKGIEEPVLINTTGVKKLFDRNKRHNDWYNTIHFLYHLKAITKDLDFIFEAGVVGQQKRQVLGRYLGYTTINNVNYEVCFRKDYSQTIFYYIRPL